MPVKYNRKRVAVSLPPFRFIVRMTNGSRVRTVLVALKTFARPSGATVIVELKISGRLGTMVTNVFSIAPPCVITIGYIVPDVELLIKGGATNVILWPPTLFSPQARPLIDSVTPLNSIGKLNVRAIEPVAVRAVIGPTVLESKSSIANIPGEIPKTAAGVTGVGVGVGVTLGSGVGEGVGVGVAVGVGVGVGVGGVGTGVGDADGKIGNPLAPVARLIVTAGVLVDVGFRK